MIVEIVVPDSLMPKKDPEHPCPCQFREFKIQDKTRKRDAFFGMRPAFFCALDPISRRRLGEASE